MRVYLGSDHAGFELKARLIEWLASAGHEPVDCGPEKYVQDDDYPVYVMRAAHAVIGDQCVHPGEAVGFARVFVSTPFSGEPRHARRLAMIADYEKSGELPPVPPS